MSSPAGRSPREGLRGGHSLDDSSLLRVEAHGSFDHRAALATLDAHAVEGLHRLDLEAGTFTRSLTVDGTPHLVTTRLDAAGALLETSARNPAAREKLRRRTAHFFDLDADLDPVDAHLGADPLFAAQVRERPGLRITRFRPPFEAVTCTPGGEHSGAFQYAGS